MGAQLTVPAGGVRESLVIASTFGTLPSAGHPDEVFLKRVTEKFFLKMCFPKNDLRGVVKILPKGNLVMYLTCTDTRVATLVRSHFQFLLR